MDEIKITKIDAHNIEVEKPVRVQQSYNELLERKEKLEKDIADNEIIYNANLAVNQEALNNVNFLISEADKLGVVEKPEEVLPAEPVIP